MPEKRYLVTPGPTPVPPEVLAATALPMIHHRSADFRETFTRVLDAPQGACTGPRTTCSSSPRPGPPRWSPPSRTSARPATASSCVSHGYFGERWAAIAAGLRPRRRPRSATSGASCRTPDEVGARLEEIGGAKVVYLTHSDTSTGGVADVQATAERIAGSGALDRGRRHLEPRGRRRSRPTSGASTSS